MGILKIMKILKLMTIYESYIRWLWNEKWRVKSIDKIVDSSE